MSQSNSNGLKGRLRVNRRFGVQFVGLVVAAHAIFILASSLILQTADRHNLRADAVVIYLPLFIGLSLLYLSTQLRSHKRTAWLVTVIAYSVYMGLGIANLGLRTSFDELFLLQLIRVCILPALVLGLLFINQKEFVVHSDIQGFRSAARFSATVLIVAFVYGVTGFSLLDNHDFHQEISTVSAIHYTIDQFDLTTAKPLQTYTKRAEIFVNSLSVVSVLAVGYVILAMFQPLRLRLIDQSANRQKMRDLLNAHPSPSEDFFKLWPHDKAYFFDDHNRAGLAFHVNRGVALCLGDPAGSKAGYDHLLSEFESLCFGNDWLPAFIHIQNNNRNLFEKHNYSLQKIGQEAVVDIEHFQKNVANNKYFRHIRNKFTKQDFTSEMLLPPHHNAVLERLEVISREWLNDGDRDERGFAMGYFTKDYMQMCPIMVVRDAAGTIQAFINQIPAEFDTVEATYDLLRHTRSSLGNINDYLLMCFIDELKTKNYQKLNLGLCPLVGLDEQDKDRKTLIDGVLSFAYANGDRFYSFSGLYKFKVKYEPEWRDRYIAYQAGIRGFTRTTNALMRTMKVK